jgi:hypothetical protein
VKADLRTRWRSWVVLGILAGITVGLACAGIAGARRTNRAVPHYARISHLPDAAVLPNDPAFDTRMQAQLAKRPEVAAVHPFVVPFALRVDGVDGMDPPLVPTTAQSMKAGASPVIAGRAPDPRRADEIAVNEQGRDAFGLDLGSTIMLAQDPPGPDFPFPAPPGSSTPIRQKMRVVGILDGAGSDGPDSLISSGFYAKYRTQLIGPTNAFVDLHGGTARLDELRRDLDRMLGRPVNVGDAGDLFGVRQLRNISDVEATGLLLFALATLIGGGALVGQALVRAVSAGAGDVDTWRAIGVDRRMAVRALVAPSALVAGVAAVATIVTAVLLSPRFPIGGTRQYDLDVGVHADWLVLVPGAIGAVLAVVLAAWIVAEVRLRRDERTSRRRVGRTPTMIGLPPALLIGSKLATDTGRGKRAVPVRSALIGAIAGVLGVVGCLTFRSGLSDTVARPNRSGIVWNQQFAKAGLLSDDEISQVTRDHAVAASVRATWARALLINGTSTPTFGIAPVDGNMHLVVVAGSPPTAADEIALGPRTMEQLGLHIGDHVTVGNPPGRRLVVVGRALLPATSHTEYDESAWMTRDALMASLPHIDAGDDFFEDYLLLRWKPGADSAAATKRLDALAAREPEVYFDGPADLPGAVKGLRVLRALPLTLAIFFGLLAVATVAHALITTVRRRRADLAILRSIGFTKRDARLAIGWQATILAAAGLVLGVPAGILVGRFLWKELAESFPVVYVPPLALVAVLLVVPGAFIVANLLAVGPAHGATRMHPAETLRSE